MPDYITPPPTQKIIPVTRGCDRAFTIQRLDDSGDPESFAVGTSVYMWVDVPTGDPVKVNATVSGSNAAFLIDSLVCDQVKNGGRWRVVLDTGDLEVPLLVGKFERWDG